MICFSCMSEADAQSMEDDTFTYMKMTTTVGHDACKGCDCAHLPVGTRQVKRDGQAQQD